MWQLARRGIAAGLWGGVAVIAVYSLYDLVRLEPLATPALLSRALFGQPVETATGVEAAGRVAEILTLGRLIAGYALLHLGAFAALGIGAAVLFTRTALPMNVLTGALYGAVAGSTVLVSGLWYVEPELVTLPNWPLWLFASAIAGVVMVAGLLDEGVRAADADG